MLEFVKGTATHIWELFFAMSPYLLLGFTVAGVMKVLIPDSFFTRHFSGRGSLPVFKAALAGIPLPLCSCGVIPLTAHLRKLGATKGALTAFIISTPSIGLASILATTSLLGWVFTLIRLLADFVIGVVAGLMVNVFVKPETIHDAVFGQDAVLEQDAVPSPSGSSEKKCCLQEKPKSSKFISVLNYAYIELVEDVAKWLLIGLVIGGLLSYLMPGDLVSEYLGTKWISYSAMLVVGLPMYVCATGSIPMIAPLILKGMNPGAGLVFLIVGPATNTATMSFVAGKLGIRTFVIYILSITLGAIIFGLALDAVWSGMDIKDLGSSHMIPHWLNMVSSIIMALMMIRALFFKRRTLTSCR